MNEARRSWFVFLAVFAFLAAWHAFDVPSSNLNDIFPGARQFVEPGWIKNDWYLDLPVGSRLIRLLYYALFGPATVVLSFPAAALWGSLLVLALFAYLLQELSEIWELQLGFLIPALLIASRHQSLVAGEWLFGPKAFEAKSFAYVLSLLALVSLIRRKYARLFVLQGLAVSFHILVGSYSAFCLLGALLANWKEYRSDLRTIAKRSWLFLPASAFGLYAVYARLGASNSVDFARAGEIYVRFRVPHHVLPSYWDRPWWGVWVCAPLLAAAVAFWRVEDRRYRVILAYILSSSLLFAVGFGAFRLGNTSLLRYYWFRLPDTIIPFLGILTAAALANDALRARRVLSRGVLAVGTAVWLAVVAPAFARLLFPSRWPKAQEWDVQLEQKPVLDWIRTSTRNGDVFLASPFMEPFYIIAQRAQFVSFKSVPQSEGDMLEWYERIKAANGGRDPSVDGFRARREIEANFYRMSEDELRGLARKYHLDYYVGRTGRRLALPVVYSDPGYSVYKLN
jgi:hypothetical protein